MAAADEFDSWLNSTSSKPAAPKKEPASSGWFGGASSLLGGSSSLMSALDTLQTQAKDVAGSLQDTLQTQAPLVSSSLTSVTSVAGAVAGHLQQTVENQMNQFSDEQAKFCTEDAKRAEQHDYKQVVYSVGKTIGVPTQAGDLAANAEDSLWSDAPLPLQPAVEEAIRKLAHAESSFLSEAQLPAAKHDPSEEATEAELQALLRRAKTALARDEPLKEMRFRLVPTRVNFFFNGDGL